MITPFRCVALSWLCVTSMLSGADADDTRPARAAEPDGLLVVRRDNRTGWCRLVARPNAESETETRFTLFGLWRYDPGKGRWWRDDVQGKAARPKITAANQVVLTLPKKIGLYWVDWREGDRRFESLAVSGPVLCNDVRIGPTPPGTIAACLPAADRATALAVPDPKLFCRLVRQHEALRALMSDRQAPEAIRIAAIELIGGRYNHFEQPARELLTDPGSSGPLLAATLAAIPPGYARFAVPYPRLVPAIRPLRLHANEAVRKRAFFLLASYKDQSSIDLLVAELRRKDSKPIPTADAIRIVGYGRMSVNQPELIRPYLESPVAEVRYEAIRGLLADAQSKPKIRQLAFDPRQPSLVRTEAIEALRNPDDYVALLKDKRTSTKYLQLVIGETIGYFNYHPKTAAQARAFRQQLTRLAENPALPADLRDIAKRYARD